MSGCEKLDWGCITVGSEAYYTLDLNSYLSREGETLNTITWETPSGIQIIDEVVSEGTSSLKLKALARGTYTLVFTVNSSEEGKTQKWLESITITAVDAYV